MAANGYGCGNLPMDIYKMVYHDNWAPFGERADGHHDYQKWGVYRIRPYKIYHMDRLIVSPEGLGKHLEGDGLVYELLDDTTLIVKDPGFIW